MIINNGTKWIAPKYKITQPIIIYDDDISGYEGATIEENILSDEQKLRLMEIEYLQMTEEDAKKYVIHGEGQLPDNRSDIDKLIELIPIEDITKEVFKIIPIWTDGIFVERGSYITHENSLYKCLQSHVTNINWSPDVVPALFAKILADPFGNRILDWEQPGSTNGYPEGAKVRHKGKIWISTHKGLNVWEPGAPGTDDRIWKMVEDAV